MLKAVAALDFMQGSNTRSCSLREKTLKPKLRVISLQGNELKELFRITGDVLAEPVRQIEVDKGTMRVG